jgi:hypothetical protein
MNDLDQSLIDLTLAHRAFARYTVYLTKANFAKGVTIVETGLTYDAAAKRRSELMASLGERRFGDPMYGFQLEVNNDEFARPFWHSARSRLTVSVRPIVDLDEWESLLALPAECVCQVAWRAQTELQHHTRNVSTRAEAAEIVRTLIDKLGSSLHEIGITPAQPIQRTEFRNCGEFTPA